MDEVTEYLERNKDFLHEIASDKTRPLLKRARAIYLLLYERDSSRTSREFGK